MAVEDSRVCMKIVLPVVTSNAEDHGYTFGDDGTRIAVLEDSSLQRKMIKRALSKEFPDVGDSSLVVHGASIEEIKAFPGFVLSHKPPFTTILVDQYLGKDDDDQMVKGTDIVKILRQRGCVATILINSANGNQRDVEEYIDAGANAYLSKDSSPTGVRRTIVQAAHSNKTGPGS